ncbi:F-box protein [Sesamum alatum]|uniref:F-box protein n=1 Tax=Sesamum alatum TaxID=300844 RepID=A0AAE1YQ74_9LAMI|nr:F-box protein [Sesamum alatum]
MEAVIPLSFSDFPEDVQLCVLSFLRPSDLAAFASTCKRFLSLYRQDQRLWFSMCHRRWGSKTLIDKWGSGRISYKHLYRILHEYENLIGFWRRSGDAPASSPPLVFFEWGPFYITGSRVSPSKNKGYEVIKKPFLWMSIAGNGQPVNYLDPDGKFELTEEDLLDESVVVENELIQVNVSFIGECHVVVEENLGYSGFGRATSSGNLRAEEYENVYGSPPDRLMTEIYQYFANRTSPSGNGTSRRQRRREREKQGRMRKWEPEHFVKIVNCSPKPARPLQGLWKGICDDMSLDFYLVSYDDVGGIACRKVGDSNRPLTYHAPIFWTSSSTFIESPFSPEEDHIYNCRLHLTPLAEAHQSHNHPSSSDNGVVSRMLYINSSYDLVIPDLAGTTVNPRHVEGRIWQYRNGTFGFGFLRDNYIIDLKHIARNGHILDTIEPSNS